MAFEFISKNTDGNLNKSDKRVPLFFGVLTAICLVVYFFRIEISLNLGYELKNSQPDIAYTLLDYASSEGNVAAQFIILQNGSTLEGNPKVNSIYKKWLVIMTNNNEPEALLISGEYRISGKFGFTVNRYLGADLILKALQLNPDIKNSPSRYLEVAKIFSTDPHSPTGLADSTDVSNLLKARGASKIAFDNKVPGSSYIYAKTFLNITTSDMSKEQGLLEATKILSAGVKRGEHVNGLLANTYVDLYNITRNKSYLISALNYYKVASLDKEDPFYNTSGNQVVNIASAISASN